MFLESVASLESTLGGRDTVVDGSSPNQKLRAKPNHEITSLLKRRRIQGLDTEEFLGAFDKKWSKPAENRAPVQGAPVWKLDCLGDDSVTAVVTEQALGTQIGTQDDCDVTAVDCKTSGEVAPQRTSGKLSSMVGRQLRSMPPSALLTGDQASRLKDHHNTHVQKYYNPSLGQLAGKTRTWKDHKDATDIVTGRYTLEEERILFDAVRAQFDSIGVSFEEGCKKFIACWSREKMKDTFHLTVARSLPRRSVKSVYQHLQKWYASLSLKRGLWTKEEVEQLKYFFHKAMAEQRPMDFGAIAQELGRFRTDVADKASQMHDRFLHGDPTKSLAPPKSGRLPGKEDYVHFTSEMDFHLLFHVRRLTGDTIPTVPVLWDQIQMFVPKATAGQCRKRFTRILVRHLTCSPTVNGVDFESITRQVVRYLYRVLSTRAEVPDEYKNQLKAKTKQSRSDEVLLQIGKKDHTVQKFQRVGLIHSLKDVQWAQVLHPIPLFADVCRLLFFGAARKRLPERLSPDVLELREQRIEGMIQEAVPACILKKQVKYLYKALKCPYFAEEDQDKYIRTVEWLKGVNNSVLVLDDLLETGKQDKEALNNKEGDFYIERMLPDSPKDDCASG